jgi:inner membrane protein
VTVENLCHTLVGAVLARAGLDRLSPLATPVALVGANLPDADVVVTLWGELAYLAGAAVAASALVRRRDPGAAPARFRPLLVVASVALASHTLLDFTNSYGVKPWLPFDTTWYYADLVFIVDPWLWLLLGVALFLGGRMTLGRGLFWAVLLGAMAVAVAGRRRPRRVA